MTDIVEILTQLSLASRKHTSKRKGVEVRHKEEPADGYRTRRGLRSYETFLVFKIQDWILSRLESRNAVKSRIVDEKEGATDKQNNPFVILDLGCGSGKFLNEVEGVHPNVTGYGITLELYEDDHPRDKIIVGSYTNVYNVNPQVLPKIPDNSIDMVVSAFSIKYNDNMEYELLLPEVHRILKPGSIGVLDVGDCYMDRLVDKLAAEGFPVHPHYKGAQDQMMAVTITKS